MSDQFATAPTYIFDHISDSTVAYWKLFTDNLIRCNKKNFNIGSCSSVKKAYVDTGDIIIEISPVVKIDENIMNKIRHYYPEGTHFLAKISRRTKTGYGRSGVEESLDIFLVIPNKSAAKRVNIKTIYIDLMLHFFVFALLIFLAYFQYQSGVISY